MSYSIYFNARAMALENRLIDKDVFFKIIECDDFDSLFPILKSMDLIKSLDVKNFKDLDRIIENETLEFFKFVKQEGPNAEYKKFFTIKNDYHNIQVYLLSKLRGIDPEGLFDVEGMYTIEQIKSHIDREDFDFFSPVQRECILFAMKDENISSFLFDTLFKRFLYLEMSNIASASTHLSKIMIFRIDCINILIALQFRNKSLFERIKVENGSLPHEFLLSLCTDSFDEIRNKTRYSDYRIVIQTIIRAIEEDRVLTDYEHILNNFDEKYFDELKYNVMGDIPYLSYCISKVREIEDLRMVFVGLQSKIDKELMKNEFRRAYD